MYLQWCPAASVISLTKAALSFIVSVLFYILFLLHLERYLPFSLNVLCCVYHRLYPWLFMQDNSFASRTFCGRHVHVNWHTYKPDQILNILFKAPRYGWLCCKKLIWGTMFRSTWRSTCHLQVMGHKCRVQPANTLHSMAVYPKDRTPKEHKFCPKVSYFLVNFLQPSRFVCSLFFTHPPPVHWCFYLSKTGVTHPSGRWAGLYISVRLYLETRPPIIWMGGGNCWIGNPICWICRNLSIKTADLICLIYFKVSILCMQPVHILLHTLSAATFLDG